MIGAISYYVLEGPGGDNHNVRSQVPGPYEEVEHVAHCRHHPRSTKMIIFMFGDRQMQGELIAWESALISCRHGATDFQSDRSPPGRPSQDNSIGSEELAK